MPNPDPMSNVYSSEQSFCRKIWPILMCRHFRVPRAKFSRSQCPRGLKSESAAARLLRLWVRIPPGEWISVCFECCVLSGRGLCDRPIRCLENPHLLFCVVVCDLETSWMRRPWPTGGCCAEKNFLVISQYHLALTTSSQCVYLLQNGKCQSSHYIITPPEHAQLAIILCSKQCLDAGMFSYKTSLMAHIRLDSVTVRGLYSVHSFGLWCFVAFLVNTNIWKTLIPSSVPTWV